MKDIRLQTIRLREYIYGTGSSRHERAKLEESLDGVREECEELLEAWRDTRYARQHAHGRLERTIVSTLTWPW